RPAARRQGLSDGQAVHGRRRVSLRAIELDQADADRPRQVAEHRRVPEARRGAAEGQAGDAGRRFAPEGAGARGIAMVPLPSVFISHGSPMHALEAGPAGVAWAALGKRLGKPKAILIASAHWETNLPMVTGADHPQTIHDFSGFPEPLYRLRYNAPGAPAVAQRALQLLKEQGLTAAIDGCRGLDHGAWAPLLYMYPDADVPVVQISLQPGLGTRHHLRLGRALRKLEEDNVLVIGSGHMTHN